MTHSRLFSSLYRAVAVLALLVLMGQAFTAPALASSSNPTDNPNQPTWWAKYQYLLKNGPMTCKSSGKSLSAGTNVDVSNECGPQSETYITINPASTANLAAGSNEIFRLPMRGYASFNGGGSWSGVDLPLPPALPGAGSFRFGSDPTLAFDTQGNLYYGYIVVFFSSGGSITGTEMAVARSTDGGLTYPNVTYFSFDSGSNHFNDKPMITVDTNPASPFKDNVYIAWDAASGGSTSGGIRVATSSDHGATFTITRADNPFGQGRAIGAVPFVGPKGELYAAWNDWSANAIVFNRSLDAGKTWGSPVTVASKSLPFESAIPAEFSRGALVYPACDTDRSLDRYRGRLSCTWMDLTSAGTTDILLSHSDDQGATWSSPQPVADRLSIPVDRFNQWLSVDPVTGDVNVSFYDTRNDTTGSRYMTDVYLAQSTNGGASFSSPDVRVSSVSSNEHDCNGTYPCSAIDYGNQQGDYEGLVSYGGVSHPVWTDSRKQLTPSTGCFIGLLMEEVYTAPVK